MRSYGPNPCWTPSEVRTLLASLSRFRQCAPSVANRSFTQNCTKYFNKM